MTLIGPKFSIITPVFEPPLHALQEAIDSVLAQTFDDWELILVDDRSPSESVRQKLRQAAFLDVRIRVIERAMNGRIVRASNDGVTAAGGEFIVLLDHDDLLTSDALEKNAAVIENYPDVDYIYSDEDKMDDLGILHSRFDKPDWSPERLRHHMYTGHLSVMRTSVVRELGAFHDGFDGSQDHDLALRVTERARRIVHIPHVLYHWRVIPGSAAGDSTAKPYAWDAGRRAVEAHVERVGIDATVELGDHPGMYRVRRRMPADWPVSVVIPTRGDSGMVWGELRTFVVEAVRSALEKTSHRNVEIVVVYDEVTPDEVLAELKQIAGQNLVLIPYRKPFNFSEKCNIGVLASTGEVIVLMNDDIHARSQDWLEALVTPLLEPDVGMTGARLLFSDGTLQHGGHTYSAGEHFHAFYGASPDNLGPFGELLVNRECSGVTAGCAGIRREVFETVGGLSELLPVNFNDVDLCRKVTRAGYRILWMADAELYHFESKTRVASVHRWEVQRLTARWGVPDHDPYLPSV